MNKGEQINSEIFVQEILNHVEETCPGCYVLSYGQKELEISVFEKEQKFGSAVENMQDKERIAFETRLLYHAAKKLMQQMTNRLNKDMQYCFETSNDTLMKFAKTHGNEIFQWDNPEGTTKEITNHEGVPITILKFYKTFHPEMTK